MEEMKKERDKLEKASTTRKIETEAKKEKEIFLEKCGKCELELVKQNQNNKNKNKSKEERKK